VDQHCHRRLRERRASGNVLKCGTVTTGTLTGQLASGFCPGKTFTFAAIYYEWTAHNNQSNASPSPIPPNSVADFFNANWTSPVGGASPVRFNIFVPVVRPDHETTVFMGLDNLARGLWEQTLIPPSSDPTFDFSGEHVNEFAAPPAGPDRCYLITSGGLPFDKIQNKPNEFWTVGYGNVYGPDTVGYGP
jgi:hypothetical protein